MRGDAGAHQLRGRRERGGAGGPRVHGAVAETQLMLAQLDTETACEIAGVEQGQPDARVRGGGRERGAHGGGIGVGHAARRVVQIVELADAGVAGQHHLRVDGAGQPIVRVRIQPRRNGVHALAPRPERALIVLGAAAQRTMEGVRVRVGESRHGQPAQQLTGGLGARDHRVDRRPAHVDRHAGRQTIRQPRIFGPIHGHGRTSGAAGRVVLASWSRLIRPAPPAHAPNPVRHWPHRRPRHVPRGRG